MESGKLLLNLKSGGKASYQHIYREAAGVYWDNERKGFHSNEAPRDWSYAHWFAHIVATVKSLGIELELCPQATWLNVPEDVKNSLINGRNQIQTMPSKYDGLR